MQQGTINVQTENIFPIIKKFLYSDHEIFLRELVSNAVDAIQKVKTLSAAGEIKVDPQRFMVEVILDGKKGTLTIRDNGIGMTSEEVDRYINQIAFSGAEEFLKKYANVSEKHAIIGHFGLGFYSAFMVASKVEILSRSQRPNSTAIHWECDGSPEYRMQETSKKSKGTDIILHIAEDAKEFLEEARIESILTKYCKFLPVPVKFGVKSEWIDSDTEKDEEGKPKRIEQEVDNIINNPEPSWTKKPSDLKDEDYKNFYRELYPNVFEEPLFHIHLNVDYPFNLTGILYFPRLKDKFELTRNKISLYSNQVFITDNVENIVPDFLTLLHGVIDSPDIPLNVSRSYLQEDSNVKKISGHITKKVADKLSSMFKENRQDFEQKWDDIRIFIEYGMLTDEKFLEKMEKVCLYKDVDNSYRTMEEFLEEIKGNQTDKHGNSIALYCSDREAEHAYIQSARERGYKVLIMSGPLSSHVASMLESKHEKLRFARVDSDSIEKLIEKEDNLPSKLEDSQKDLLKESIGGFMDKSSYSVVFENLGEQDAPMIITQNEFSRRMKEQQMTGGGMNFFGNLPDMYNLIVNTNHPVIYKAAETDEATRLSILRQTADLALLGRGMLKGEALTNFIKRSTQFIQQ
jgi:molecular chaperone HtpG